MSSQQQSIAHRLETERLIIRRGTADDAPAWTDAAAASWAELSVYLNWAQGPKPTLHWTLDWAKTIDAWFDDRTQLSYVLFEKRTGAFVGNCWLSQFDWTVPRGEIGYWCATDKVGRGYITEAVVAMTEFAWSLGLVRLELRCDARNLRSRAVAERAGYTLEGVLRNDCRTPQGALRTTYLFAQIPNQEQTP
jgi:RimJ/RimL family protein N-acetyltransferase